MPPKGRSKKTKEPVVAPPPLATVVDVDISTVVATVEPVVVAPPVPTPTPVSETKAKKPKKQPKIVAVVTPDGIEGSFLPEPRRPLIAHLQINSTDVQFHETPLFYDPNPPVQPEPYDAQADDMFGKHNEEVQNALAASSEAAVEKKEEKAEVQATTSLEAFTKCELMVQYKELQPTKKIPSTTEIACFWCAHQFSWQPSVIPEREEKTIYRVYGNFCSPNCCMAYLLHESLDTHVRWERIALLHRLYGSLYSSGRIFPSPSRESLKLFGGPMTIQQYRGTIAGGKVRVDLQTPPMVSILGSIDTKPIDFYDSSMKHTISPLLGEVVPKAEEGLRLKRSKPLKERESTLDSVLKIAIKGKK
jgi:hypothetical protein